ncbi:MAG: hypothetical protein R3E86_01050 [Pseudomonadales bacterium]
MAHRPACTAMAACLRLLALLGAWPAVAGADVFERTWCELSAPGITLVSEADETRARQLLVDLRGLEAAAEHYLPGTPATDRSPLTIVLFERYDEFRHAFDRPRFAGFMQPSLLEQRLVVGPDPGEFSLSETLFHEYAHYLLRSREDVNLPVWFDEGMASFLSTARIGADSAMVGELPADYLEAMVLRADLEIGELLGAEDVWQWPDVKRLVFYARAWLLVHRLMLGARYGLSDTRDATHAFLAGKSPNLAASIGLTEARLQRQLRRYLARAVEGGPDRVSLPSAGAGRDASARYRCLDDAARDRLLAQVISLHNPERAAAVLRALLARAPRADLYVDLSLAEELMGDGEAARATARQALALDVDSVNARVRLAEALVFGCLIRVTDECLARWQLSMPLLHEALRLDPARYDAMYNLGLAYLYTGRAGDALDYLRVSQQRAPWAPHMNFYLGEAYRLTGDSRARNYLLRAAQWSATEFWRQAASTALQMLDGEHTDQARR